MSRFVIFILILFATTLFSCKRNRDKVTPYNISGIVYNNCTDSGLAGVTVYLKILKDDKSVKKYEAISNDAGVFVFANADLHSNERYTYNISIPSKSGIGIGSETRFDGGNDVFTKDKITGFLILNVTPGFLSYTTYFERLVPNPADSLKIVCEQRTFHKNVPNLPYNFPNGGLGGVMSANHFWRDYPMGKYHLKIEKIVNGIRTYSTDSIYLPWKSAVTQTINW